MTALWAALAAFLLAVGPAIAAWLKASAAQKSASRAHARIDASQQAGPPSS